MHDLASVRKVLAAAFEEENSNAPATREGELENSDAMINRGRMLSE